MIDPLMIDQRIIPDRFEVLTLRNYEEVADGIRTMAVGLILTPQQAEEVAAKVDLVAIGREALFDPNWPLHAAQVLNADPEFARWPVQYGWWLTRRESLLRKLGVRK